MKKLFFILYFILAYVFCFSQPIVNRSTGSNTVDDRRFQAGLNMFVPRYLDTTFANLSLGIDSCGAQIFTYDVMDYWVRKCSPKRWARVSGNSSLLLPQCGLQSGTGIVTWDSLLVFDVSAAIYALCCDSIPRSTVQDSIQLPAADPSNPVYVAIILDANGVNYVRGVPAANPSLPQLTNCQIALTYVLINAGDVVPANVSVTTIYDENYTSEWDSVTTSTLVMDTANTTFPVHLLKDIDVTSYGTGGYMEFWTANTVDLNNYGILKFYVRLKGVATIRFALSWYLDGVQQTFSAVPLVISGITGVYQVMAVPISAFRILNNSSVNKLRIQVFGTQGFYLDWIQLQAGIIPSSPIDNGFTTLNVGNLDSLFNSFVTFPIGQPVVNYTKQNVPAYTALVNPNNTSGPFVWNKINLATPIITGLLPVTNIAPGNANDILTTIGGISTWVSSASGYDTTITFNWLRSYPGTVRDSIAFGSPYLDSALLTFDTYVGLDNKFLKIMQDGEILFLLDPAGFSAFLRAYDGVSESVIGTEADLVNSSLFFTLKSKNGADSVWIVGNGQNKKITFIADSLLFKSTLSGATTGMVWKLKDVTTGSGYWGAGSSYVTAGNGLTDSSGRVILGGNMYKTTTITTNSNTLNLTTSTAGATPLIVTSTLGSGIVSTGNGSAGSLGIGGNTDIGVGVGGYASSTGIATQGYVDGGGLPLDLYNSNSSTNTVLTMAKIRRETSGTSANGIGGSIDFYNETVNGSGQLSNQLISKFTDATTATRTSQFIITGVNSAATQNLLSLAGSGQLTLDQYTGSNFNTAQAKVAMIGTDGKVYGVDTTGLFGGGGGGGNTIYTGDGTLSGNRIVDQNFNNLSFININTFDISGDADIGVLHIATQSAKLSADLTDYIDMTLGGISYVSTTHTFTGNVGIGVTPTHLFQVSDGTTNDLIDVDAGGFFTGIKSSDGTATSRIYTTADLVGTDVTFNIRSFDGTNAVEIEGDAIAQTITLTAANGVTIAGSLTLPYTAQTTTYPITAADYTIDCTSGTFTTTLPTAVGIAGRIYVIKNSGAGTITIATTSSQTIDGVTTKTLSVQYSSYTIISDGANWKII